MSELTTGYFKSVKTCSHFAAGVCPHSHRTVKFDKLTLALQFPTQFLKETLEKARAANKANEGALVKLFLQGRSKVECLDLGGLHSPDLRAHCGGV